MIKIASGYCMSPYDFMDNLTPEERRKLIEDRLEELEDRRNLDKLATDLLGSKEPSQSGRNALTISFRQRN